MNDTLERNAMAIRRVLVVEDDAVVREILSQLLAADGNAVYTASTGHEALQQAAARPMDAVLLDLGLPDMPGLEVCRALSNGQADKPAPAILVLTASTHMADVQAAFDAGATDYLTKPFSPSQVRARLRTGLLRNMRPEPARGSMAVA